MGYKVLCCFIGMLGFTFKVAAQLHLPAAAHRISVSKQLPLLPQNFYTQHLSFFCKKEDQIQKRTGLNLYFRLGTKAYVDWLEQKPNAPRLP